MKKLLNLKAVRHIVLGLILTCVTASTLLAANFNAQASNTSASVNPRVCINFYYFDPDAPVNAIWDCWGCFRVVDTIVVDDPLQYFCTDGTWGLTD